MEGNGENASNVTAVVVTELSGCLCSELRIRSILRAEYGHEENRDVVMEEAMERRRKRQLRDALIDLFQL